MEAVLKYSLRGRLGLKASEVGFGCGSVGGLPVRGEYPEMRRARERALEPGISQFDTASLHGDGQSEVNLGAVLPERGADPIPGTKVRLEPPDPDRVEAAIRFASGRPEMSTARVGISRGSNRRRPWRAPIAGGCPSKPWGVSRRPGQGANPARRSAPAHGG